MLSALLGMSVVAVGSDAVVVLGGLGRRMEGGLFATLTHRFVVLGGLGRGMDGVCSRH